MSNLIIPEKLEKLFLNNWTTFIDKTALLHKVLQDARDASLPESSESPPASQLKISISRFQLLDNTNFEIWVEFSIPKDNGAIVGSHIYHMNFGDLFQLKETYGMCFKPKV